MINYYLDRHQLYPITVRYPATHQLPHHHQPVVTLNFPVAAAAVATAVSPEALSSTTAMCTPSCRDGGLVVLAVTAVGEEVAGAKIGGIEDQIRRGSGAGMPRWRLLPLSRRLETLIMRGFRLAF